MVASGLVADLAGWSTEKRAAVGRISTARARAPAAGAPRVNRTIHAPLRKRARNLNAARCPDWPSGGMNNPGAWAAFPGSLVERRFPSGVPARPFGKQEHD